MTVDRVILRAVAGSTRAEPAQESLTLSPVHRDDRGGSCRDGGPGGARHERPGDAALGTLTPQTEAGIGVAGLPGLAL
jgi:hypothetical protein